MLKRQYEDDPNCIGRMFSGVMLALCVIVAAVAYSMMTPGLPL